MKNFLFNFKTKPTLFTLFIIIGFLYAIALIFNPSPGDPWGIEIFIGICLATGLIPNFILYRYIIKHFKTKYVFITESLLIVLFMLGMLVVDLSSSRHLVFDLTNYSENYFLIVEGEDGEQQKTDTRPSTFLINEEAVLHENYFVIKGGAVFGDQMYDAEIIYPESWKVTVEVSTKQIYWDPFIVQIHYNEDFDFNSRALDSLATLVIYARQHDISVSQAKKELANVWAEMNYIYTTPLEPYEKNSIAHLHIDGVSNSELYEKNSVAYQQYMRQSEATYDWNQIVITPPSDNGIYLSYTSYERIIDDLKRRAEHNNWPEQTIDELTEYYTTRMPDGYYRLFIERPAEELANSDRFRFEGGYLPSNLAKKNTNGSGTTNWTNTVIFRKYGKPDSTFQVIINELFTDADGKVSEYDQDGKVYDQDSFSFDMKMN